MLWERHLLEKSTSSERRERLPALGTGSAGASDAAPAVTPLRQARRARLRWLTLTWWLLALAVLLLAMRSFVFNVDTEVAQEDAIYLQMIAKEFGNGLDMSRKPRGYAQELATVRAVQKAVLAAAPDNVPLAVDGGREPKDVFLARSGLCYDRSRVIEKMLTALGMQVRHIAMYQVVDDSKMRTLLTGKVPSHAITEVRTERGWLVVDSNAAWLSLGTNGEPYSLAEIQAGLAGPGFRFEHPELQNSIYQQPFTFVYGLYSRHGRFYSTRFGKALVNANFRDFLYNVTEG
jgi:hypothetical protein